MIFLQQKMFKYLWAKDSNRGADIYFSRNDKGSYSFTHANFYGTEKIYTIDDWEFLRELSTEILRITEEEARG